MQTLQMYSPAKHTGENPRETGGAQTGAMNNAGARNITPGTSDVAISQGYHDGTGKVDGDADLDQDNIIFLPAYQTVGIGPALHMVLLRHKNLSRFKCHIPIPKVPQNILTLYICNGRQDTGPLIRPVSG